VSNSKVNPRQYAENELIPYLPCRAAPSAILDGIETAALLI
jgi:hypothetical protein